MSSYVVVKMMQWFDPGVASCTPLVTDKHVSMEAKIYLDQKDYSRIARGIHGDAGYETDLAILSISKRKSMREMASSFFPGVTLSRLCDMTTNTKNY